MVSANSDRFENGLQFDSLKVFVIIKFGIGRVWKKKPKKNRMKWIVCIAIVAIGGCVAEQNKAFRERAEIYSSNVCLHFFPFEIHRNYSTLQENIHIFRLWQWKLCACICDNPFYDQFHSSHLKCWLMTHSLLWWINERTNQSRAQNLNWFTSILRTFVVFFPLFINICLWVHLIKPVFVHNISSINYELEHKYSLGLWKNQIYGEIFQKPNVSSTSIIIQLILNTLK